MVFTAKDGRELIVKRRGREVSIWHGSTKTLAVLSVALGPKGNRGDGVLRLAEKVAELCGESPDILPAMAGLTE